MKTKYYYLIKYNTALQKHCCKLIEDESKVEKTIEQLQWGLNATDISIWQIDFDNELIGYLAGSREDD